MKVRDLAHSQGIVCLAPHDSVLDAARMMAKHKIGSVLVASADGKIEGIFTERDLMVKVVAGGSDPGQVALVDVMTSEVYTTTPDRFVTDVRREMQSRHIRHVPVVQDDRVLAVLGMRDLMRADLIETRREKEALTAYIRGEGEPS